MNYCEYTLIVYRLKCFSMAVETGFMLPWARVTNAHIGVGVDLDRNSVHAHKASSTSKQHDSIQQ